MEERIIKEKLLNDDCEIGYVVSHCESYYMPSDEKKPEMISRPMPKKLFDLGKENIGFPEDIWFGGYGHSVAYENEFITYDKCTDKQKKEIDKRKERLEKFIKKVSNDKTGYYDKLGTISIPVFKTNTRGFDGLNAKASAEFDSIIEMEITQRELAEAGILPEDFKWMKKVKVSPKDIAKLDQEQGLTTTEVGGFKGFIKKLVDKFKGIGEK